MSNKFKAVKNTVGFFALASIIATLLVYSTLWIPLQYIVYAMIIGMFIFGFWMMYEFNLEKLEREEENWRSNKPR
jgi:cytochrome c biogenesis protein CcdA